MSKQSAYYQELQVMLEKPGCPVCHAGYKAARQLLENLLWGSVNDPATREELDQAMGFCGQHSRDLLTFSGERLGTAIIQQAILKEALRRVEDSADPPQRTWLQRFQAGVGRPDSDPADSSPLRSKGSCPICQHQYVQETRSLEALVEHLVDDLNRPLLAAGGLCWDHLGRALAMSHDPTAYRALVALQAQIWQGVIRDLGEFIRKRDYRFSSEPISDAEGASMQRSMAILTGEYPVP
jgi:hypothetical protein